MQKNNILNLSYLAFNCNLLKRARILISFFRRIYYAPGYNFLLHNALLGNISSQYELAKFYLLEEKNYIEAFAWADVANYRKHPDAYVIKSHAQKKLNTEQTILAWKKARCYKLRIK